MLISENRLFRFRKINFIDFLDFFDFSTFSTFYTLEINFFEIESLIVF